MAQFHFVEDYQNLVKHLISTCSSIDEAMEIAIGGYYHEIGNIECDVLLYAGLEPKMTIIDYGCGSGRLANALPEEYNLSYTGIDIVDEFLDYAQSKVSDTKKKRTYKFMNHQQLSIPAKNDSVDMICAFSLFTHLLQAESYIYI